MVNDDNAVTEVAAAVARLGNHKFPITRTATVDAFLGQHERAHRAGVPRGRSGGVVAKIGPVARIVNATLRNTANPTMLKAGYKANVIPSTAEAASTAGCCPGGRRRSARRSTSSSARTSSSSG